MSRQGYVEAPDMSGKQPSSDAASPANGPSQEERSWRRATASVPDATPTHFIVAASPEGWLIELEGLALARLPGESAALAAADRLARLAHVEGRDSRILRRTSEGQLLLERSYGRHPLVRKPPVS